MRADAMASLGEKTAAEAKKDKLGRSFRMRLDDRMNSMKRARINVENAWWDISDYISPHRVMHYMRRPDELPQIATIMDSTAQQASNTATAGLLQGMASPERPWFQATVDNPALARDPDVLKWLDHLRDSTLSVFDKSDWYSRLAELFQDELDYGSAAIGIFEDDRKVIRCETYPVGSFVIGQGPDGVVDTFGREFTMAVSRAAEMYGRENLSDAAQALLDGTDKQATITLRHMILRNEDGDVRAFYPENLPYQDVVWEHSAGGRSNDQTPQYTSGAGGGEDQNKLLELSGYHEFPIMVVRWAKTSEDVWATSWPGRTVLPDVKTLQEMERDALNATKKMVDPALVGGPDVKNNPMSLVSGELSIDPSLGGPGSGVRPIHEVRFPVEMVEMKAEKVRERVRRGYFMHLFLAILGDDRSQRATATEVQETVQEKLTALAPMMERHSDDLFDPAITRTTGIMIRRSQPAWQRGEDGLLQQPPQQMAGEEWRPQYISEIAAAQKLSGINNMERHGSFVGGHAEVYPEALDVYDADEGIRLHAEALSLPASLTRTAQAVEERRAIRAQQAQQQQQMEQLPLLAKSAKDLADTPVGQTDTALARLIG